MNFHHIPTMTNDYNDLDDETRPGLYDSSTDTVYYGSPGGYHDELLESEIPMGMEVYDGMFRYDPGSNFPFEWYTDPDEKKREEVEAAFPLHLNHSPDHIGMQKNSGYGDDTYRWVYNPETSEVFFEHGSSGKNHFQMFKEHNMPYDGWGGQIEGDGSDIEMYYWPSSMKWQMADDPLEYFEQYINPIIRSALASRTARVQVEQLDTGGHLGEPRIPVVFDTDKQIAYAGNPGSEHYEVLRELPELDQLPWEEADSRIHFYEYYPQEKELFDLDTKPYDEGLQEALEQHFASRMAATPLSVTPLSTLSTVGAQKHSADTTYRWLYDPETGKVIFGKQEHYYLFLELEPDADEEQWYSLWGGYIRSNDPGDSIEFAYEPENNLESYEKIKQIVLNAWNEHYGDEAQLKTAGSGLLRWVYNAENDRILFGDASKTYHHNMFNELTNDSQDYQDQLWGGYLNKDNNGVSISYSPWELDETFDDAELYEQIRRRVVKAYLSGAAPYSKTADVFPDELDFIHVPTKSAFMDRIPFIYDEANHTVYYGDRGGEHFELIEAMGIMDNADFFDGIDPNLAGGAYYEYGDMISVFYGVIVPQVKKMIAKRLRMTFESSVHTAAANDTYYDRAWAYGPDGDIIRGYAHLPIIEKIWAAGYDPADYRLGWMHDGQADMISWDHDDHNSKITPEEKAEIERRVTEDWQAGIGKTHMAAVTPQVTYVPGKDRGYGETYPVIYNRSTNKMYWTAQGDTHASIFDHVSREYKGDWWKAPEWSQPGNSLAMRYNPYSEFSHLWYSDATPEEKEMILDSMASATGGYKLADAGLQIDWLSPGQNDSVIKWLWDKDTNTIYLWGYHSLDLHHNDLMAQKNISMTGNWVVGIESLHYPYLFAHGTATEDEGRNAFWQAAMGGRTGRIFHLLANEWVDLTPVS